MIINVLGISGSPRKGGSSSILLDEALKGAATVDGVEISRYEFAGKRIAPCNANCVSYCTKNRACAIKDDFQDLREIYSKADAVIWSAPVYHAGPCAQVKCALDRLANVEFMARAGAMKRLNKVCTAIVQGSSRWGGQELAIQYFINSFVMMKCLPIAGDMPASYFGVAGHAPSWKLGCIVEDEKAMQTAFIAGIRVAETAKIVQVGLATLKDELPDIYYETKTT
ncbi:MAG TPA: flavodoxin family protein [Clostridiaceae bacterium]|jgi:multimeric flavodoxin WrbA|nr:flavodoxin family protein [Clostridiaceae bacterium]